MRSLYVFVGVMIAVLVGIGIYGALNSPEPTKEDIFEEYDIDLTPYVDTLNSVEGNVEQLVKGSLIKTLDYYSHKGDDNEDVFVSEIDGELFTLHKFNNIKQFGDEYETLYLIEYIDYLVYVDESLEVLSIYYDEDVIVNITSWNGFIDMKVVLLEDGSRYNLGYEKGELVSEELHNKDTEMIILYDECREVGEIYLNSKLVYSCDNE